MRRPRPRRRGGLFVYVPRNTKLEDVDSLVREIEELCSIVGEKCLRVSPSAGLDFLPREKARAKLGRLVEAAKEVN